MDQQVWFIFFYIFTLYILYGLLLDVNALVFGDECVGVCYAAPDGIYYGSSAGISYDLARAIAGIVFYRIKRFWNHS